MDSMLTLGGNTITIVVPEETAEQRKVRLLIEAIRNLDDKSEKRYKMVIGKEFGRDRAKVLIARAYNLAW